jgi:hypothetical protein
MGIEVLNLEIRRKEIGKNKEKKSKNASWARTFKPAHFALLDRAARLGVYAPTNGPAPSASVPWALRMVAARWGPPVGFILTWARDTVTATGKTPTTQR